jgi:hypothetical protein
MGVDVAWVNERHEAKQEVFDPRQCLTILATSAWPGSATVCLRFIDAFGDTVFNQAQIPLLLSELREAERQQSDPEIKSHLGKVSRLVERAVGQTHTFIIFIGD